MDKNIKNVLLQAQKTQKKRNHSVKLCPDQFIGEIKYDSYSCKVTMVSKVTTKGFVGSKRENITDLFCPHNSAAIVLILESPHIDEYDVKKNPIGPAYGETGKNINRWLTDILNNAISQNVLTLPCAHLQYDLIAINAIQRQTSLGVDPLIYRDAMFLRYWEMEDTQQEFIDRVNKIRNMYGNQNVVFINCCTKGEHLDLITFHKVGITKRYISELGCDLQYSGKASLQHLVGEVLSAINIHQYYVSHPSSWSRNSKNRKLK